MKLRLVKTCSFQKSELNNFLDVVRERPELGSKDSKYRLQREDVVLLVSKMENQLVFLHGFDFTGGTQVLRSTRFRISNSKARWNPLLLANYARTVGIQLSGLQAYEDHIKREQKR
jgi:hypothetical protein